MKKTILFAALAVVVIFLLANSLYVVEENEYGVTFRFSEIVGTEDSAGLNFKIPFIDEVQIFPKTTMLYDIPPSEVLTEDKKTMTVDCYILWSISDPQQFYRALGSTEKAEVRLDAITYNALKTAMGTLKQDEIINEEDGAERNKIYESIAATVDEQARAYGITVEDVKIKQFDLPESNLNAVYGRMISERNQMAEAFVADGNKNATITRNLVDREVKIKVSDAEAQAAEIVAQGEAEYMRILAEALNTPEKREFYEFTLALQALEDSLQGDNKMIILDADSPLAQVLMGK